MTTRARGGSFQADFKLPGWERVRETFKSHAEAVAYEMECRAAHALGKPKPTPGGSSVVSTAKLQTIGALVEHCAKKRWGRLTSRHAKLAPRNAELFAEWCGPNMAVATALTEEKIEEYCEHREAGGNSGSTVNRHLAAISVLVSEASRLKLIDTSPTLPKRKEGQARIRVFTEPEERMILATCEQWGYMCLRSFFIFLVDTGCRSGEVMKLRWEDFEGDHIVLEREITKNSTQRVLTMTPRVKTELARMRVHYADSPGPYSWVTERQVRTLWDRLRGHLPFMGEDTIPYTFRHTCLSRLVRGGVDLYRVQLWAGHKSPLMTQRYAKFAPKQLSELAAVLSRGETSCPL